MRLIRNICRYSLIASLAISGVSNAEAEVIEGLTVIVSFEDVAHKVDVGYAKNVAAMLNESDYHSYGNVGSLRDYFLDNSAGKLDLRNTVLMVELPHQRSVYADPNAEDQIGRGKARNPYSGLMKDVPDLVGGPLYDLQQQVLCRILSGCADPAIGVQYWELNEATGEFVARNDAFDFSRLSTTESVFHLDWLDQLHFIGSVEIGQTVIPHYSFIQILVPGSDGGSPGKGVWPRSIPSTNTEVSGLNGYALGRVQLVPLNGPNDLSIGTIVHEAGHTLFNFKDLYDTQSLAYKIGSVHLSLAEEGHIGDIFDPTVWFESSGVADFSLMGSVRDGHRNPPLINAHNRELAGWEQPKDLINAGEGEIYTIDWHADGTDPTVARAFKYCKPRSNVNECFYIEARSSSWNRAYQADGLRSLWTPDDGLMIWHAEYYANPVDTEINQRKEGSAGLHFDVSLVQADGLRELEGRRNIAIDKQNDLFHAGYNDAFDKFTSPSSNWWDGTDSGLSLRNISHVGSTMSFEIGARPVKPVMLEFEATQFDVVINGRSVSTAVALPVGPFAFSVTPKTSASYKVFSGADGDNLDGDIYTGLRQFTAHATYDPNIIRIQSTETSTKDFSANLQLDEGVLVHYLNKFGEKQIIGSILTVGNERDLAMPSTIFLDLWASPRPGFRFKGWSVDYKDGIGARAGKTERIRIDSRKLAVNGSGDTVPPDVRVYAERIPGLLCAEGKVEDWRWDGVYSDIGVVVRDGNSVYSTNVPRAHSYDNRRLFAASSDPVAFNSNPAVRPHQEPRVWTKIEMCGDYTQDCSATPVWRYGAHYDLGETVQHNGKQWKVANASTKRDTISSPAIVEYPRDSIPGAHSIMGLAWTRSLQTADSPEFDLGIASLFVNPFESEFESIWELQGSCDSPENIYRSYVDVAEGIVELKAWRGGQRIYSIGHGDLPAVTSGDYLAPIDVEFKVSAGFHLEGVFVDGIERSTSQSGGIYSFTLDYAALGNYAHYVELRTSKP